MNTEIAKLISRHCSSKETYEKYVDVMQKVEAVYNPDANLQEILDCKQSFEDALQLIGQCKGIYSQYPHNSHQILNEAFYFFHKQESIGKSFIKNFLKLMKLSKFIVILFMRNLTKLAFSLIKNLKLLLLLKRKAKNFPLL